MFEPSRSSVFMSKKHQGVSGKAAGSLAVARRARARAVGLNGLSTAEAPGPAPCTCSATSFCEPWERRRTSGPDAFLSAKNRVWSVDCGHRMRFPFLRLSSSDLTPGSQRFRHLHRRGLPGGSLCELSQEHQVSPTLIPGM